MGLAQEETPNHLRALFKNADSWALQPEGKAENGVFKEPQNILMNTEV